MIDYSSCELLIDWFTYCWSFIGWLGAADGPAAGWDQLQGNHHERRRGDEG